MQQLFYCSNAPYTVLLSFHFGNARVLSIVESQFKPLHYLSVGITVMEKVPQKTWVEEPAILALSDILAQVGK